MSARPSPTGGGRVGAVSVRGDGLELARGGVPEIQRARILAALVGEACERGVGRVTVAHVVARSGVSRRTFYELFDDRDACFLTALEDAVQRAAVRVVPAWADGVGALAGGDGAGLGVRVARGAGGAWCTRVRAGLVALLGFLDEEPGLGELCVVDALAGGPAALAYRVQVVAWLVDAVDEGRMVARTGCRATRLTAEGVVNGVLGVLYARIIRRRQAAGIGSRRAGSNTRRNADRTAAGESLLGLSSELMGMVVLPYLGVAAAAREAARPAPVGRAPILQPAANPLEGLGMRLTYRTVQVLAAIEAHPGANNRQVARAAGVLDQGQMSKLLARLTRAGLLANDGHGASHGEPNAWRLTARGEEVQHAIQRQTPQPTGAT